MATELHSVVGFHKVNNVKARELLQPHIQTDGYYLLRPSSDIKGGVLCTICVTNKSKLMNYRLVQDPYGRGYYIHSNTPFSSINLLIAHYKTTPINVEANTRLLYPVGVPRQENPSPEQEDAYVIMEKQPQQMSPSNSSTDIPGLYNFLPKSEINAVMGPYIGTNGYYLLRPSSTSEGQLTLAVSHSKQVRNFKINLEKNQYYISPKKRFHSVRDLVVHYQSHPIRSKKAGNENILLLHPIPVDQEREKVYQEIQQQKAVAKQQATALAPGWTEHWHNTYNRPYYYNAETGQSLWDKPLATPTKQAAPPLPDKNPPTSRPRMKDRPLPSVPGGGGVGSEDVPANAGGRRASRKFSRPQQPLPSTPSYSSNTLPARKISSISERELPPLPPKDDSGIGRRGLPPLPPKEESGGVRGEAHAPGIMNRPPIPIPDQGGRELPRKSLPPLPPKEDKPLKQPPPAPVKPSLQNGHPPLPQKEEKRAFPPLPPKVDEPTPLPPHLQTTEKKKARKKIVEYEDIFPAHQADTKMASKNKAPPPPLPEKEGPPPAAGGGPPPPTIGAPPPPPLPPAAPPSPSPGLAMKQRSNTLATPSPQSSPGSGRPFTAGDLASQRNMLKKRTDSQSEEPPRKEGLTGMASIFASAIDTRRKAMEDSESESDFDDVEDDDWD